MAAEAAEADVGQPRSVVVGVDPQGEMVERRPQPAGVATRAASSVTE
jgi:hypothetical protein